jgi:hypothetical protein
VNRLTPPCVVGVRAYDTYIVTLCMIQDRGGLIIAGVSARDPTRTQPVRDPAAYLPTTVYWHFGSETALPHWIRRAQLSEVRGPSRRAELLPVHGNRLGAQGGTSHEATSTRAAGDAGLRDSGASSTKQPMAQANRRMLTLRRESAVGRTPEAVVCCWSR